MESIFHEVPAGENRPFFDLNPSNVSIKYTQQLYQRKVYDVLKYKKRYELKNKVMDKYKYNLVQYKGRILKLKLLLNSFIQKKTISIPWSIVNSTCLEIGKWQEDQEFKETYLEKKRRNCYEFIRTINKFSLKRPHHKHNYTSVFIFIDIFHWYVTYSYIRTKILFLVYYD